MIVLFTDYGLAGPYTGQVEAILYQHAPLEKVISLIADVPRQNPKAASYLLDAYTKLFPAGTIFLCVVDPNVGTFRDKPVVMKIENNWFVGPDNGLFDIVARRSPDLDCLEISWVPENLSSSFHGRDLYAMVCAMLANGREIPGNKINWVDRNGWPDELAEVIYIDGFGNCVTGLHAGAIGKNSIIRLGDRKIHYAGTFAGVAVGKMFWYVNSSGLVEIAINQGNAASSLQLGIGSGIEFM